MRLLFYLGIVLCCLACKEEAPLPDLRDNLFGEWNYIVANTHLNEDGSSNTYYYEGFIHLHADGTGTESTIIDTTQPLEWQYQNDPPQITKVTTILGTPVGEGVTYDILINEKNYQEWYNEFSNNGEKTLSTWSLSRR